MFYKSSEVTAKKRNETDSPLDYSFESEELNNLTKLTAQRIAERQNKSFRIHNKGKKV